MGGNELQVGAFDPPQCESGQTNQRSSAKDNGPFVLNAPKPVPLSILCRPFDRVLSYQMVNFALFLEV